MKSPKAWQLSRWTPCPCLRERLFVKLKRALTSPGPEPVLGIACAESLSLTVVRWVCRSAFLLKAWIFWKIEREHLKKCFHFKKSKKKNPSLFLHYLAKSEIKMSEFLTRKKSVIFTFSGCHHLPRSKTKVRATVIYSQHLRVVRRMTVGFWDIASCFVTGWYYLLCWILPISVDSQWPASCKR